MSVTFKLPCICKATFFLTLVSLILLPLQAKAEKPNLKAGLWRVAIQMNVPNASGPATGPVQYDRCLNADNAQEFLVLPPNAPCTIVESNFGRDKLTWSLTCSQGGYRSNANGLVLFKDTALNGEVITETKQPQAMRITTKISGRYIGKCITVKQQAVPKTKNGLQKFQETPAN